MTDLTRTNSRESGAAKQKPSVVWNCLHVQSDGVAHTRYLAEQHSREAVRQIMQLNSSVERDALVSATQRVLNRLK